MEESISLQEIAKIIRKRLILMISLTIISVGITAGISYYVITPIYQAQTQILVNQKIDVQEANVRAQQLQTDLQLINTYNVIITSNAILSKVIEKLEMNITPEQLKNQITVSSENNSKVVNIQVEDEKPLQAVEISNTVAEVFKEEIPTLMSVDNINILSVATLDENPSPVKPNKMLNMAIAAVVGLMVSIGVTFLMEMLDTTIKNEKDIEEILALPVMGLVGPIVPEKEIKDPLRSRRIRRN